jgi:nucleotide-binding universal stress UspA family protein
MSQRILAVLDGGELSDPVLQRALDLVLQTPGAVLRVVTAVELPALLLAQEGLDDGRFEEQSRDEGALLMEEARTVARRRGVEIETAVLTCVDTGVAREIVAEAQRWHADAIVAGAPRGGLRRLFRKSLADHVAGLTQVPVVRVGAGQ